MELKSLFKGDRKDIEKLAADIRRKLEAVKGINTDQPNTGFLQDIVKFLRGEVFVSHGLLNGHKQIGGSLVAYADTTFHIYLHPDTSHLRDNFTIAHELGHYFLHIPHFEEIDEYGLVFNRYGATPYEWQANKFAAAFLMPENEFKKAYAKYKDNLYVLAYHFDVSVPAVQNRIKDIFG